MLTSTAPQDRLGILLIAEEVRRREVLTEAFRAEGFDVAQARNVAEARAQARLRPPDLVVIDPAPTASVPRELNRLRADRVTGGVPLIVIRRSATGRAEAGHAEAGHAEHGAYAWTASAIDMDLLLEHVWRVVNMRVLPRVGVGVGAALGARATR